MFARTAFLCAALAAAFFAAPPAAAQDYRSPLPISTLRTAVVVPVRACAVEARRDCGGAQNILACLIEKPFISSDCAQSLRDSSEVIEALLVCGEDISFFCEGVVIGRGRVMTCLADNYDLISRDCYVALLVGVDGYRDRRR